MDFFMKTLTYDTKKTFGISFRQSRKDWYNVIQPTQIKAISVYIRGVWVYMTFPSQIVLRDAVKERY